jgi:hypothetical protein
LKGCIGLKEKVEFDGVQGISSAEYSALCGKNDILCPGYPIRLKHWKQRSPYTDRIVALIRIAIEIGAGFRWQE